MIAEKEDYIDYVLVVMALDSESEILKTNFQE